MVEEENIVYRSEGNCLLKGGELILGCKNSIIPDGVTSIAGYAFYGCSGLTNITIPDSVTNIGDFAFFCCSSLTSITIPDSVTNIGNSAFEDCSSLTSITIPASMKSFGYDVFNDCTELKTVYYQSAEGNWEKITNYTVLNDATIIYASHADKNLVEAVEATCTENGSVSYYECSYCQAKFDADDAELLIEDETTLVISAIGHSISTVDAVAATCTEEGHEAYYVCDVCSVKFADAEGLEVIEDDNTLVITATGHTEVIDTAVAATCTTNGLTEGSHCSVCQTVLTAQ